MNILTSFLKIVHYVFVNYLQKINRMLVNHLIFRMNAFIYVLRCAIRGFGNLCLPNLQATNINPSINFRMNVFITKTI